MTQRRIGIYAGTFDPVHLGHVVFALQAVEMAKLDVIYFLPERRPRRKQGVEHFAHRVAMLRQASRPHPQFDVLELPDVNFTVRATLPRLQKQFPDDQLVFLFGSDVISSLAKWEYNERLLSQGELVVAIRENEDPQTIKKQIETLPVAPKAVTIFTSREPDISSANVREALYGRSKARGLLTSVERYSDRNWLYVSLASSRTR